ncbi:MAG: chloramphenicol acetyltransferase [Bacteroidia bacterium]|nr:chloramphenicol acetyltransferase [Bacteroidia bacterium]
MTQKLDISTWARKEHFHFFRKFDEPFWGVCVEVDCTIAYQKAKEQGHSFFLSYLHKSIVAVNQTEAFRYRIEGEEVIIHDTINASSTINRDDGTFGFSYIPYAEDFETFVLGAKAEIERVRNSTGLKPARSSENVIHYSSLPWVKFTAISHARAFHFPDSIPKISFGKITAENGKVTLPVSVHVHHALADGYHVGQHLERFQDLLNT